jgi:subtilisin family serine protease
MFRTKGRAKRPFSVCRIESLESRELLSGEPWGQQAKLIGQDLAAANYPTITGAGQTIAIIDSGVDYKHAALGGGIGAGFKVVAGYDFVGKDGDPMPDTFAHGTATAGVAAANAFVYNGQRYQGIAPGAKIIALREDGTAGVKAALDWVLANRTKYNIVAVNMTDFGGGNALIYRDVLKSLIAAGVFVSHPSGNEGPTVPVSTALDPADFAIGSVNLKGNVSTFTERGAELDLLAPGEGVTLPYYDIATRKHTYLAAADGTSWASPAVAGAAALIKQIDPRFTPAQIMKILQDSGTAVYDGVSKLTYKRLNVNAALGLAYQRKQSATTPQPPLSSGPTPVPPQTPFAGTAARITAQTVLQAENFDNGGQNVSYFDAEATNLGWSAYRKGTGVDVTDGTNGVKFVGCIKAGEWLEYTVNVAAAGTYQFSARVASLRWGGSFHIEVDGVNKTGPMVVGDTKGWQNWVNLTAKSGVALTAGTHVIRFKGDTGGKLGYVANVDSFTFTKATSAYAPIAATAYSAQSAVANKGTYLANLDKGDWVAFGRIDFGATGAKSVLASVAAPAEAAGKVIEIRLDSGNGKLIGSIKVPATGGWTSFQTVKAAVSGASGIHDVFLTFPTGKGTANLQWIQFA